MNLDDQSRAALAVGWGEISLKVGNTTAAALAKASERGTLGVKPLKIGRQVAMTPQQIEQLRRGRK